jgi:hypothetical protein
METTETKNKSPFALSSDSKVLHVSARILTVFIAVGAFVLSFSALSDLAVASGILPELGWVWALSVDGFIIINTLAAFSLQNKGKSGIYAWSILVLFVILSIFGNAWHAVLTTTDYKLPLAVSVIITAIPPITLFLSVHLLILMVQPTKEQKLETERLKKKQERLRAIEEREIEKLEKEAVRRQVRESKAAEMIRQPSTPAKPQASTPVPPIRQETTQIEPAPQGMKASYGETSSPLTRPDTLSVLVDETPNADSEKFNRILTESEVFSILVERIANNEKLPSGKTVGEWIGKSERTGQNLVKKFKSEQGL